MRFRYSVVRFVPSLIRDEAVNLGVLLETEQPSGFYVQLVNSFARVRSLFPEADTALLGFLQTHFRTLHKPVDVSQPVFGYSEQPGPRLDELYREQRNTVLQLTSPRVTLGANPERELGELFDRFVAGAAAKPAESPHLAPSALRRQVGGWLEHRGLIGQGKYQRNIQATGTVAPWIFDFGLRNGQLTLVQTLALSAPIQVGLDRALLLQARAADVKAVEREPVDFVVLADTVEKEAPAVRYLTNHELEVLPADDKQRVEERLSRALLVRRSY